MNRIKVEPFHCEIPLKTGAARLPASIHVLARPSDLPSAAPIEERALFDTGAEITILSREWAQSFDLIPFLEAPTIPMNSRHGLHMGQMIEVDFTLCEEGEAFTWTGQAWISDTWPGPTVIGWRGALELLRFHLDPANSVAHFAKA